MKKNYLKWILILMPCMAILLQNCGSDKEPECPNGTQTYPLDKSINYIPHTGFDTIIMVNNTGDTIICKGQGKQYFTTSHLEPNANPDCPITTGITHIYDAYKISYVDNDKNIQINVAYYTKKFFEPGYLRGYQTDIWEVMEIIFKNTRFYVDHNRISNPNLKKYYKGDMEFNGKLYKAVTLVTKDYFQDSTSNLYINKDVGIIQINLNGSEHWTLGKQ